MVSLKSITDDFPKGKYHFLRMKKIEEKVIDRYCSLTLICINAL